MGEALHLIMYCLTFHSEIFRSHRLEASLLLMRGSKNLALDSAPMALEQGGSLWCLVFCSLIQWNAQFNSHIYDKQLELKTYFNICIYHKPPWTVFLYTQFAYFIVHVLYTTVCIPWRRARPFLSTNFNPLHHGMLCVKFNWYWHSGFGEEDGNEKMMMPPPMCKDNNHNRQSSIERAFAHAS